MINKYHPKKKPNFSHIKLLSFSQNEEKINENKQKSFLELSSKNKHKHKKIEQITGSGTYDFFSSYSLLNKILENIISDNPIPQKCLKNILSLKSIFDLDLENFWNNSFKFYITEKFTQDSSTKNMIYDKFLFTLKLILKKASEYEIIYSGIRRYCSNFVNLEKTYLNKENLIYIMEKDEFFGNYNYINKNAKPFIDSQFSTYRQNLQSDSFYLLNKESRKNSINRIFNGNRYINDNIYNILNGFKSFKKNYNDPRKKDYLYKSNYDYDFSSVIKKNQENNKNNKIYSNDESLKNDNSGILIDGNNNLYINQTNSTLKNNNFTIQNETKNDETNGKSIKNDSIVQNIDKINNTNDEIKIINETKNKNDTLEKVKLDLTNILSDIYKNTSNSNNSEINDSKAKYEKKDDIGRNIDITNTKLEEINKKEEIKKEDNNKKREFGQKENEKILQISKKEETNKNELKDIKKDIAKNEDDFDLGRIKIKKNEDDKGKTEKLYLKNEPNNLLNKEEISKKKENSENKETSINPNITIIKENFTQNDAIKKIEEHLKKIENQLKEENKQKKEEFIKKSEELKNEEISKKKDMIKNEDVKEIKDEIKKIAENLKKNEINKLTEIEKLKDEIKEIAENLKRNEQKKNEEYKKTDYISNKEVDLKKDDNIKKDDKKDDNIKKDVKLKKEDYDHDNVSKKEDNLKKDYNIKKEDEKNDNIKKKEEFKKIDIHKSEDNNFDKISKKEQNEKKEDKIKNPDNKLENNILKENNVKKDDDNKKEENKNDDSPKKDQNLNKKEENKNENVSNKNDDLKKKEDKEDNKNESFSKKEENMNKKEDNNNYGISKKEDNLKKKEDNKIESILKKEDNKIDNIPKKEDNNNDNIPKKEDNMKEKENVKKEDEKKNNIPKKEDNNSNDDPFKKEEKKNNDIIKNKNDLNKENNIKKEDNKNENKKNEDPIKKEDNKENNNPKKDENLKKEDENKKEDNKNESGQKKEDTIKKGENINDIQKKKEEIKKEEKIKKEDITNDKIPKKEDNSKKNDTNKNENVPKKEENSKKDDRNKNENVTKKEENSKKDDTNKYENIPKKEDNSKKDDTSKNENIPKEEDNSKKDNTNKNDNFSKREENSKKDYTNLNENVPKKEENSKKDDTNKYENKKTELKNEKQNITNIIDSGKNNNTSNITQEKLSSQNQNKAMNNSKYFDMLIFGNIGQIEYFNDIYKLARINLKPLQFYERVITSENIILNNNLNQCIVKYKQSTINLNQQKGLENFKNLFLSETTQNLIKNSENILFIGETISVKASNKLVEERFTSKFFDRINCAWNIFLKNLEEAKLLVKYKDIFEFEDHLDIILGKPSLYEVDPKKNFEILNKLTSKTKNENKKSENFIRDVRHGLQENYDRQIEPISYMYTDAPRIISIHNGKFLIQMIDFNSFNLVCLTEENEEDFNDCLKRKQLFKISPSFNGVYDSVQFIDFAKAKKYAWKLACMIKKKFYIQSSQMHVWRIMRAIHAPTNTISGDNEFYFKELSVLDENNNEKKINLFKEMKEKAVNIFISSEIRAAQVIAYPYSRIYRKKPNSCVENIRRYGCSYARDDTLFKRGTTFNEVDKCKENLIFDLPINLRSVDPHQNMLYIFNIGNSGRDLEGINTGRTSNGYIIWQRSITSFDAESDQIGKSRFGYANMKFDLGKIEIEFYEIVQKDEIKLAAFFNIQERIMPDQNIINGIIDYNFCN